MKQSYDSAPPTDTVKSLANELVMTIMKSGVTFRGANDALNLAWDFLESQTSPVIRPSPVKSV